MSREKNIIFGTSTSAAKPSQSVTTNREYKDRLFKFIFKDKTRLLSLYNALNSTSYTNAEDIEITTLEDVIYCKMKNDISFIIDDRLSLFEHQSSFNPNMPLRGFLYFAKHFDSYIVENKLNIYGNKLVELPTPKLVVFYNGTGMDEERRVLRLSDAFTTGKEKACMELEALVLDINYGKNKKLMEACHPLKEYAYFVEKVKRYSGKLERDKAIELAVEECVKENILKEILLKHRAEVVDMVLTEYDEEKWIQTMNEKIQLMELEIQKEKRERERIEKERERIEQERERIEMEREKERLERRRIEQENQELLKLLEEYKKVSVLYGESKK